MKRQPEPLRTSRQREESVERPQGRNVGLWKTWSCAQSPWDAAEAGWDGWRLPAGDLDLNNAFMCSVYSRGPRDRGLSPSSGGCRPGSRRQQGWIPAWLRGRIFPGLFLVSEFCWHSLVFFGFRSIRWICAFTYTRWPLCIPNFYVQISSFDKDTSHMVLGPP